MGSRISATLGVVALAATGIVLTVLLNGQEGDGVIPATAAAPPAAGSTAQGSPRPVANGPHSWSEDEKVVLSSLQLSALPPLPPDPSNEVADNPAAAELGHSFFFDTRFSGNGRVSCASCHKPEHRFVDGLPRGVGMGVTDRKTMTVIGTAYGDWFFWDGRKDSAWSQALGPPESPVEHGGSRGQFAHIIADDPDYRRKYQALFGPLPELSDAARFPDPAGPIPDPEARQAWESMTAADRDAVNEVYANMGKAIAAYQRLIMPGPAPFDTYVAAAMADDKAAMEDSYTRQQARGLHLFIGKAQCTQCHNGPLLTNNSFHNTGVPPAPDLPPDLGRSEGVHQARQDPFNCLGEYSAAEAGECGHLRFARTEGPELTAAFKVPTLRNVADMPPYMHAGQLSTLAEVIHHYSHAPRAVRGDSELQPLHLTPPERQALEAFLHTLSGPLATAQEWQQPPPGLVTQPQSGEPE